MDPLVALGEGRGTRPLAAAHLGPRVRAPYACIAWMNSPKYDSQDFVDPFAPFIQNLNSVSEPSKAGLLSCL